MTTDLLEATSVKLRWYKRSVERRYDDDVQVWRDDPPESSGLKARFNTEIALPDKDDDDGEQEVALIRLRLLLVLEQPQVSAEMEAGVEFTFSADADLARERIVDFVKEQGLPYIVGIQRGALADITRSVGLPAVMVPPLLPKGVVESVESELFSDPVSNASIEAQ